MVIPILIFLMGFFGVLAYFTREKVTYTAESSSKGGLGMAIIIFIIFAIVGYFLDVYLGISLIFQYMFGAGGALQAIAVLFWAAFILLILSMLYSAQKTGRMVS
jgi:hypothetical protein